MFVCAYVCVYGCVCLCVVLCCVQVGLIYVFNLIVGTGALTMPAAFMSAGWLISLITIIVLAFVR